MATEDAAICLLGVRRKATRAMTDDPFKVDRLFAAMSDESRAIESLGEVLARLEAVQEAKRRLALLDPEARRAAIAVRHARLERL